MAAVTIVICDDHQLVRQTIAKWLNSDTSMRVVGEARHADDAVSEVVRLKPDVLVMDIDMPGRSSFDAARTIRAASPSTRLVFLSGYLKDRYIAEALELGAAGYVLKSDSTTAIVEAIRAAAAGRTYFSPEVQERLSIGPSGVRLANVSEIRADSLTGREIEVLRHLARGLSKKQIAQAMHISPNTVNRHATSVMRKLDIHDRVDLARYAIREGLSEP